MDKKDLKEIMSVFKPMNEYYSLLLEEKENELFEEQNKHDELMQYALLLKKKIKQYKNKIIVDRVKRVSCCENMLDYSFIFLKTNQLIEYKDDDYPLWDVLKSDFKLIKLLDEMILKINEFVDEHEREALILFIDKYSLIVKEKREKDKTFLPDSSWLTLELYMNEDILPAGCYVGPIVHILKAKLRIPMAKQRISLNRNLRLDIAKQFNWKCNHCSIDLSAESSAWEINHIDRNPSNNNPKNLELTCRTCNKKWGG